MLLILQEFCASITFCQTRNGEKAVNTQPQILGGLSQSVSEPAPSSSHCFLHSALYHLSRFAQEQIPPLKAKGQIKGRVAATALYLLELKV